MQSLISLRMCLQMSSRLLLMSEKLISVSPKKTVNDDIYSFSAKNDQPDKLVWTALDGT